MTTAVTRLRIATAAILVPLVLCVAASAADYAIVVNAGNPVTALDRRAVSALFLRRVTQWDGGTAVLPVDGPNSPAREAFSREIHGKKAAAVRSHWLQMIFSGRGVPPPEKASDKDVIDYVRANTGAIGYVAAVTVTTGVRVVKVEP